MKCIRHNNVVTIHARRRTAISRIFFNNFEKKMFVTNEIYLDIDANLYSSKYYFSKSTRQVANRSYVFGMKELTKRQIFLKKIISYIKSHTCIKNIFKDTK